MTTKVDNQSILFSMITEANRIEVDDVQIIFYEFPDTDAWDEEDPRSEEVLCVENLDGVRYNFTAKAIENAEISKKAISVRDTNDRLRQFKLYELMNCK